MFVYLVQHAEAKSKEEDPARDLSEKGRQDIQRVANTVGKFNLVVNHIFHSGKARASTTAQTLASSLKPPTGVSDTTGLAPLDDPESWVERVATMDEDIMLVGHLPHLCGIHENVNKQLIALLPPTLRKKMLLISRWAAWSV